MPDVRKIDAVVVGAGHNGLTTAAYLQPFFLEAPPDPDKRGIARLLELLRVGKR